MIATLTSEQEILLKKTRDSLGRVRDAMAATHAKVTDRNALAESIRQLDELFLLVVAGEFNAGKSSFINALLGEKDLLQEGVTPTTAQVYLLKYGPKPDIQPHEKGIWERTAPIEMLKNINIVDTPGTNAINREHEALTTDFIPRSDLVLFLTSADRPFSESERAFLEKIKEWGKKIVLVINKVDIFEDPAERRKVIEFVNDSSRDLIGPTAGIFPVSAKMAKRYKIEGSTDQETWDASGFERLESFILDTLDNSGRFRLKVLNPLGVGQRLLEQQREAVEQDWQVLEKDAQLLEDIDGQMALYNQDKERQFEARIAEIENILYEMERRGNDFFDDTMRVGRITDLIKSNYIKSEYERVVVADAPRQIEDRVGELIDWMVEQDLRQWTAVSDHLSKRRDEMTFRVVGQGGSQDSNLAYDRQRLIDSIGKSARRTVDGYDRNKEATRINSTIREAIVGLSAGGVLGGATIAVALSVAAIADFTGIIAGFSIAALSMFVFPNRRRKAKSDLSTSLQELRVELVDNLRSQYDREKRRSKQRLDDSVAPFSRFVRAEQEKLAVVRDDLIEVEEEVNGLIQQANVI